MSIIRKITSRRLFWPFVGFFAIIVFNIFFTPNFLEISLNNDGMLYGYLVDIFNRAAPLIILATGMTFVIATGGIDISVGSLCAISAAVACYMMGGDFNGVLRYPFWLALLSAILVCTALGLFNGFLVTKLDIPPVVATLILLTAGRGIAQLITSGQIITVYYKPYYYIGTNFPGIVFPTAFLVALVFVVIVFLFIKNTSLQLFIEASGVNRKASMFSGIKSSNITWLIYGFSGLCAGISGILLSSMIRAADANNAGLNYELDAILAVALGGNSLIGGRFSLMGSVLGALTIQALTTTMYAKDVSPAVLPVVKAIVVIIICTFQSETFRTILKKAFSRDTSLATKRMKRTRNLAFAGALVILIFFVVISINPRLNPTFSIPERVMLDFEEAINVRDFDKLKSLYHENYVEEVNDYVDLIAVKDEKLMEMLSAISDTPAQLKITKTRLTITGDTARVHTNMKLITDDENLANKEYFYEFKFQKSKQAGTWKLVLL